MNAPKDSFLGLICGVTLQYEHQINRLRDQCAANELFKGCTCDAASLAEQTNDDSASRVVVRVVLRSLVHVCKLKVWDEYAWHKHRCGHQSIPANSHEQQLTCMAKLIDTTSICLTVAAAGKKTASTPVRDDIGMHGSMPNTDTITLLHCTARPCRASPVLGFV